MKITFLGTSHGIQSADRFCSCTAIETGGNLYLIDCGAPAMDLIKRYHMDQDSLRGVFITHNHADHHEGLFGLTSLMQWWHKKMSVDFYLPNREWIDFFQSYLRLDPCGLDTERTRYHCYSAGVIYDDGTAKVTAIPTDHAKNSHAFLFEAEGKKVFFTGDLHKSLCDFPQLLKQEETDATVCECAHFPVDVLKPHLLACKTKQAYINHIYPMEKFALFAMLDKESPFPIRTVNDGDVIYI